MNANQKGGSSKQGSNQGSSKQSGNQGSSGGSRNTAPGRHPRAAR
jgi:hypothetical protein